MPNYDNSCFDPLRTVQLDGFQSLAHSEDDLAPGFRANPIDANHDGILDWVVQVIKPGVTYDQFEDTQVSLYLLESTGLEFERNEDELLVGSTLAGTIYGLGGNDIFQTSDGHDYFDGGSGIDTVIWTGEINDYEIQMSGKSIRVNERVLDGEEDTLTAVERLHFLDSSLAFDLDGNAGSTAKLLGVVFGAESVNNAEYVGIGLSLLDNGMTYNDLANLAMIASGASSSDDVVTTLWENLFESVPTEIDKEPFVDMLNLGLYSWGELTILAAEQEINQVNINLTGLSEMGIEYLPVA